MFKKNTAHMSYQLNKYKFLPKYESHPNMCVFKYAQYTYVNKTFILDAIDCVTALVFLNQYRLQQ